MSIFFPLEAGNSWKPWSYRPLTFDLVCDCTGLYVTSITLFALLLTDVATVALSEQKTDLSSFLSANNDESHQDAESSRPHLSLNPNQGLY